MRYEAIEILGLHGAIVVVEGIGVCIVVVLNAGLLDTAYSQ